MNTARRPQRKHITWVLLALAVVLLVGSAIGSTRAALVYYSENYTAEIVCSHRCVQQTNTEAPVTIENAEHTSRHPTAAENQEKTNQN